MTAPDAVYTRGEADLDKAVLCLLDDLELLFVSEEHHGAVALRVSLYVEAA